MPEKPIAKPRGIYFILFVFLILFSVYFWLLPKNKFSGKDIRIPDVTLKMEKSKEIHPDWVEYKNPTFNYSLKYPQAGVLEEIGDPNKEDCVFIKVGSAYLAIKSPAGSDGGCLNTSRGSYDVITPSEEIVSIRENPVSFSGNLVDSSKDPNATRKFGEFFRTVLKPGFVAEYGGNYNLEDKSGYLVDKEIIKNIVSTLDFTDLGSSNSQRVSISSKGIDFFVPNNLVFMTKDSNYDLLLFKSNSQMESYANCIKSKLGQECNLYSLSVKLSILDNPDNLSLEAFSKKIKNDLTVTSVFQANTLGSYSVLQRDREGMGLIRDILLSKNGHVYVISGNSFDDATSKAAENLGILNELVATMEI